MARGQNCPHRRLAGTALAVILLASAAYPSHAGVAAVQTSGSVITTGQYEMFVQPDAHLSPVLQLIRSARRSLRLEIYLLTNRSIITELQKARARGVDVKVLLEQHPYGAGRYAQLGYTHLQSAGVPVRWANENAFTYTHEKSMEVDGTTAGIFTFNFSSSGFLSNREFGLIEKNSKDAGALAAIFDADWNRRPARFNSSDLVVSPVNSRRTFTSLIDSAHHTLDLYAEEVADPAIESHLASAVRRGVRVRLIVPSSSSGVDTVRASGVAVKLQPQPYVHAKAIVADGHAFFIGSENISPTSLDRNREVGISLDNRALAGFVEGTFNRDWGGSSSSSSPPPPPPSTGGSLRVRVVASPPAVSHGDRMTITAQTRSGASCSVRVVYPDGYQSRARSVRAHKRVSWSGTVSWSLYIGTRSTGTGRVTVSCTLGGTSGSGTALYSVR